MTFQAYFPFSPSSCQLHFLYFLSPSKANITCLHNSPSDRNFRGLGKLFSLRLKGRNVTLHWTTCYPQKEVEKKCLLRKVTCFDKIWKSHIFQGCQAEIAKNESLTSAKLKWDRWGYAERPWMALCTCRIIEFQWIWEAFFLSFEESLGIPTNSRHIWFHMWEPAGMKMGVSVV